MSQFFYDLRPIYVKRSKILDKITDTKISTFTLDAKINEFNAIYEAKVVKKFGINTGAGYIKAVWVWNADLVVSSPDEVLTVCNNNYMNRIYVTWNNKKVTNKQYAYFIEKANSLGIKVEALMGDPLWGLKAYNGDAVKWVTQVIDYNKSVSPYQQFYGVSLDVEPYLNKEWKTLSSRKTLLQNWYDNSVEWTKLCRLNGLRISVAFPFWLDTSDEVIAAQPLKMEKPFYQMMMDLYDEIQLMAYRGDSSKVSPLIENELNYVNNKKIIIGFEITDQGDDNISYFNKGYGAFHLGTSHLHYKYSNTKGYAGIAVHDYEQLKKWTTYNLAENPCVNTEELNRLESLYGDILVAIEQMT